MSRPLPRLDVRAYAEADPDVLAPAAAHLRRDGLVAYPTETVYGFGGATTRAAVSRLLALKARSVERPVLLLVEDAASVADLVWTDEARELAEVFWPGALTLVLADAAGRFPPGVRSERGGVAVRRSAHPVAQALVRALGGPLTSTSANAPGAPPARSGAEAAEAVAALDPEADVLVLDAGVLPESAPSTVVDCTGPVPVVLRAGAVPSGRLRCVIPEVR